jgi:hypothetical protein
MTSYYARASRRRHSRGMDWSMGLGDLIDTVQRKPEALLLIGAGVALMMRGSSGIGLFAARSRSAAGDWRGEMRGMRREGASSFRPRQGSYQSDANDGGAWPSRSISGAMSSARGAGESAAHAAGEASENMTRYASDMMNRASEAASSYASTAGRWADEAREGFMDRSQWLAERARFLPEELDEAVQDHPLVLAALGVAVGAALGATLPSTSIENRAMGQVSDDLWEAAEDVTGRLGEDAGEAYDEAFATAEKHGLSKQGLKEMATDVAAKFAGAATGEEPSKDSPRPHQTMSATAPSAGGGAQTGQRHPGSAGASASGSSTPGAPKQTPKQS